MAQKLIIQGIQMNLRDWFTLLDDNLNEQATEAMNEQGRGYQLMTSQCTSLYSAINKFDWAKTSQGNKHWEKISRDLQTGEGDKHLNPDIEQNF
tara:strand:+ start:10039 stop:10320 length:282 start_codon:yes stop_codon:yes gene_type:complete